MTSWRSRALAVGAEALELQANNGEALVVAVDLFVELAHLVFEREGVLLLVLLKGAEALHVFGEVGDLGFEIGQEGGRLLDLGLLLVMGGGQFAELALEGERAGAGLLAAADGVPVVGDAFGQQEVEVRVLQGEALGRFAILDQEAAGETGNELGRGLGEAVRRA